MRVAVNLTWLDPGRVGGSEEYLTRQLAGLRSDDVELFVTSTFAAAHPELDRRFATHVVPIERGGRLTRVLVEHSWLARRVRGADLVHHGGGTAPTVGPRPFLLTVHDLQYRTFPEYFSAVRRRYLAATVPRSVRTASVVATPSEFVRREVIEAFDADPERVVVVPHGVPRLDRPGAEALARVRSRWGLGDRPYVVYPAITHPHKGHRLLVETAMTERNDLAFVFVGGAGAAERDVARAIERSARPDLVVRTGRVSEADRDALVAGADALVFASEFEGFGAPVVEAMELGTPVVCSAAEALREVVGDAGVVVESREADVWASAITTARERRAELVAAARERRARFTVEASGEALAAAYRRALS